MDATAKKRLPLSEGNPKAPAERADLALPLFATSLVPHRPPMCLIEALTGAEKGGGTVTALVPADGPFTRDDGFLEDVALVEMLAQAYAALQGYEDRLRGEEVKRGFLVGVRSMSVTGSARAGDRLEMALTTVASLDGFAIAEGEVRRGEEVLARGSLKLWISPDPAKEEPCAV